MSWAKAIVVVLSMMIGAPFAALATLYILGWIVSLVLSLPHANYDVMLMRGFPVALVGGIIFASVLMIVDLHDEGL